MKLADAVGSKVAFSIETAGLVCHRTIKSERVVVYGIDIHRVLVLPVHSILLWSISTPQQRRNLQVDLNMNRSL